MALPSFMAFGVFLVELGGEAQWWLRSSILLPAPTTSARTHKYSGSPSLGGSGNGLFFVKIWILTRPERRVKR